LKHKNLEFVMINICCAYDTTGTDITRAKQQANKGTSYIFLY